MPFSMKLFTFTFLMAAVASGASSEQFIQQNAVQVTTEQLPVSILNNFSKTKLLMIGEMHGANESPKLVERFARLFTDAGKTILIGLEIPETEQATIDQFFLSGDTSLLKKSNFFNTQFQDGRESAAMANLLAALRTIKGVHVVCFDISDGRKERDLGMATNFVNARARVKPDIAITLSGNCHSKLTNDKACTKGEDPMGTDIVKLSDDLSLDTVTSLDVRYESGSSWNAMSDYFGVHQWSKVVTPYTNALAWDSYLLLEPPLTDDGYNGTFFFRTISASLPYAIEYPQVVTDLSVYRMAVNKMNADFDSKPADISDIGWVKSKLHHMFDLDQYMRNFVMKTPIDHKYTQGEKDFLFKSAGKEFESVDLKDTADLKALLQKYEWIKISVFGHQADQQAWLIVQHADLDHQWQVEVLAVLERLYKIGETDPSNYAYLFDRVAVAGHDPAKQTLQRYGTQGRCSGSRWLPDATEDEAHLDDRRKSVGLQPEADYIDFVSKMMCLSFTPAV